MAELFLYDQSRRFKCPKRENADIVANEIHTVRLEASYYSTLLIHLRANTILN